MSSNTGGGFSSLDDLEQRIRGSAVDQPQPSGGSASAHHDSHASPARAPGPGGVPSRSAALAAYHGGSLPPNGAPSYSEDPAHGAGLPTRRGSRPPASPSASGRSDPNRSCRSSHGSAPGSTHALPPSGYPPSGAPTMRAGGGLDSGGCACANSGGGGGGMAACGAGFTAPSSPLHSPMPEFVPLPKPRPSFDASSASASGGAGPYGNPPPPSAKSSSGLNPQGGYGTHVPLPTMAPPPRGYRPTNAGGERQGGEYDAETPRLQRTDGGAGSAPSHAQPNGGPPADEKTRAGSGAGGVGKDEADEDGAPVGCPQGRLTSGVGIMVAFFFLPLFGLFALSRLSALHSHQLAVPFWCPEPALPGARGAPRGGSAHGGAGASSEGERAGPAVWPLAFTNRSSGLQAGFSDLLTDPSDGCLRGCEATPWPLLSELPPDLAVAAMRGTFDLPAPAPSLAGVGAAGGGSGESENAAYNQGPLLPPTPGEPVRLRALAARLAPPRFDMTAACSEHDRCYATWRRRLSSDEHRRSCDGELLVNLLYACRMGAEAPALTSGGREGGADDGGAGGAAPAAESDRCELLARLAHFLAAETGDYVRAQAAAEAAVVAAVMAALPPEKSRGAAAGSSGSLQLGADGSMAPTEENVADWATAEAGHLVGAVYHSAVGPTGDPDPVPLGGRMGEEGSEDDYVCEVRVIECDYSAAARSGGFGGGKEATGS